MAVLDPSNAASNRSAVLSHWMMGSLITIPVHRSHCAIQYKESLHACHQTTSMKVSLHIDSCVLGISPVHVQPPLFATRLVIQLTSLPYTSAGFRQSNIWAIMLAVLDSVT